MTEAEWLVATDPVPMLDLLKEKASDRKLRLFAVSLARHFWGNITEPAYQDALDLAEQASDGAVGAEVMRASLKRMDGLITVWQAATGANSPQGWLRTTTPMARSLHVWLFLTTFPETLFALRNPTSLLYRTASETNRSHQPPLLREAFGNPFRPARFSPSWRTSTTVAIASGMYDARDFSAIPILADALQDAGCDRADVLEHCRSTQPHVRGCWVVDLVLGKS